ncbi:hypothetical protein VUR80DRAFT_4204 [Thermomyces stellatus]
MHENETQLSSQDPLSDTPHRPGPRSRRSQQTHVQRPRQLMIPPPPTSRRCWISGASRVSSANYRPWTATPFTARGAGRRPHSVGTRSSKRTDYRVANRSYCSGLPGGTSSRDTGGQYGGQRYRSLPGFCAQPVTIGA